MLMVLLDFRQPIGGLRHGLIWFDVGTSLRKNGDENGR